MKIIRKCKINCLSLLCTSGLEYIKHKQKFIMKKLLVLIAGVLLSVSSYGQSGDDNLDAALLVRENSTPNGHHQWQPSGNKKLDSLMFLNERLWNETDSLNKIKEKQILEVEKLEENFGIERNVDKFTNEIQINTNILSPITLYKHINKGKPIVYYLSLEAEGATLNYGTKGVIVLFSDGTKWTKPNEKVESTYRNGLHYSCFITLSPTDVELFSKKSIKAYRLYIYDASYESEDARVFANAIRKIKSMK